MLAVNRLTSSLSGTGRALPSVPAKADFGPISGPPVIGFGIEAWYVDGSQAGWTVPRIGLAVCDVNVVVHVASQQITNRVTIALAPSQCGTNADNLTATLPPPWLGQRFYRLRKE